MNYRDIVFLDFETTSVNPYSCQPTQLAAICINGRKLEIKQDTIFRSYIRPEFDIEKCSKLGLDEMSDGAIKKTGITKEMLEDAPPLKIVWMQFQQYIQKLNPSKNKWMAPIKAGFNINRYDSIIIDRICGGHNRHARKQIDYFNKINLVDIKKNKVEEPYGFGPWDDKRCEETLFAPRDCIDLMHIVWTWTENLDELQSLSMDSIREWLGISKEGAHNAVKDVMDGAEILIRFLRRTRSFAVQTKFKNSFKKKENG